MADEKQYLRTILLEARRGLTAETADDLSALVQARLLASTVYQDCTSVVLYAPHEREVATALIAADALSSGRRLYYPIVDRARHRMSFGAVTDPDELRPGAYAIPEPPPDAPALEPAELAGGALVCVPGVAFTAAGIRLGRGGGYYDRMLAALAPGAVAAGLGYSFQLLDQLPCEAWDRRLDFVVTESAVYAAGRAPGAVAHPADQGGTSKWT